MSIRALWTAQKAGRGDRETTPSSGSGDTLHFEGVLRVRRLPEDWTPEQFLYWWCPETDGHGKFLQKARISEREKERYTIAAFKNMLMIAGRIQILSFIGASNGNATGFAKYLAVGTGAIQYPTPTDTTLANETLRKALTAFTVQGTQVDCNFQFAAADAQAALTEAGLFGGNASATRNSGTLNTHALFQFTKGNFPVSIDYMINLF